MNKNLKRGIKGQMILPAKEEVFRNINDNIEIFKTVVTRDFEYCIFEMYEATYSNKDVIGIDFNILNMTIKESNTSFSRFKKEIYNHFGYKPTEVFIEKYDKM